MTFLKSFAGVAAGAFIALVLIVTIKPWKYHQKEKDPDFENFQRGMMFTIDYLQEKYPDSTYNFIYPGMDEQEKYFYKNITK